MLKLSEFSHNHHRSGVKLLAKNIRRGIRVQTKQTQRSQRWHQSPQSARRVCQKLVGAALDFCVGTAGGFRKVDAWT